MHGTLLYLVEMERPLHTSEIRKELTTEAHRGREVIDNPPSMAPIIYTFISEIRSWSHGPMQLSVVGIQVHARGYVNSSTQE